MSILSLENISKRFKETSAVRDVTLEIASGEFFSILGPSGCGKTTLLRLIAGFESPTAGRILLDGKDMTPFPPQARAIGMVFQNYALFPHMTVSQNVAFGLETKKVPRSEIRRRVDRILESVHLLEKRDVPVPNLSGGQQQRVAVARALVVEPAVLLFDEPLSNLDVALRLQTREEIRALQRRVKITTIYVTHDQSEAMSLSDRIAVMRSGVVEQVGTPSEIYESPRSPFVAGFLGGANILRGVVSSQRFQTGKFTVDLPPSITPRAGSVDAAVKPEAIALSAHHEGDHQGHIVEQEYLGYTTNFVVSVAGLLLRVSMLSSDNTRRLTPDTTVGLSIDWSRCTFFPAD